jgi:hypothetical protein
MSAQQQITIDKVEFTSTELSQLDAILQEIPYKHAVKVFDFVNAKLRKIGEEKLAELQAAKEDALKAVPAVEN